MASGAARSSGRPATAARVGACSARASLRACPGGGDCLASPRRSPAVGRPAPPAAAAARPPTRRRPLVVHHRHAHPVGRPAAAGRGHDHRHGHQHQRRDLAGDQRLRASPPRRRSPTRRRARGRGRDRPRRSTSATGSPCRHLRHRRRPRPGETRARTPTPVPRRATSASAASRASTGSACTRSATTDAGRDDGRRRPGPHVHPAVAAAGDDQSTTALVAAVRRRVRHTRRRPASPTSSGGPRRSAPGGRLRRAGSTSAPPPAPRRYLAGRPGGPRRRATAWPPATRPRSPRADRRPDDGESRRRGPASPEPAGRPSAAARPAPRSRPRPSGRSPSAAGAGCGVGWLARTRQAMPATRSWPCRTATSTSPPRPTTTPALPRRGPAPIGPSSTRSGCPPPRSSRRAERLPRRRRPSRLPRPGTTILVADDACSTSTRPTRRPVRRPASAGRRHHAGAAAGGPGPDDRREPAGRAPAAPQRGRPAPARPATRAARRGRFPPTGTRGDHGRGEFFDGLDVAWLHLDHARRRPPARRRCRSAPTRLDYPDATRPAASSTAANFAAAARLMTAGRPLDAVLLAQRQRRRAGRATRRWPTLSVRSTGTRPAPAPPTAARVDRLDPTQLAEVDDRGAARRSPSPATPASSRPRSINGLDQPVTVAGRRPSTDAEPRRSTAPRARSTLGAADAPARAARGVAADRLGVHQRRPRRRPTSTGDPLGAPRRAADPRRPGQRRDLGDHRRSAPCLLFGAIGSGCSAGSAAPRPRLTRAAPDRHRAQRPARREQRARPAPPAR